MLGNRTLMKFHESASQGRTQEKWILVRVGKTDVRVGKTDSSLSTLLKFIPFMKIIPEKKVTHCCPKQSIKTLLTLELSQYRKRGSMFSSSKQVAASSDCSRLENALCLSSPVCPAHCGGEQEQSRRAAPRAWQLILPSNPLITFWNSLWRDCQMTGRSSNLDSNLNSATWPTSCKGLKPLKSQHKLCGVWILKSATDAKFEPIEVTFKFLRLMPSTEICYIACYILEFITV